MMGNAAHAPKTTVGFGAYSERKRRRLASLGGQAVQDKGTAYVFTRAAARKASLSRTNHVPLRSRKRAGRYEYYVAGSGWVSRQRVYQLRLVQQVSTTLFDRPYRDLTDDERFEVREQIKKRSKRHRKLL